MDRALRDRWLARARARFSVPGHHAGATRMAVIELLASEGQCLLDAQQIIERLRPQRIGSPASVYRILQELHELGLLSRISSRDGIARYEIADPHYAHHHFIDERTGTISPFHDRLLDQAIRNTAERLGVTLTSHEITLRGTHPAPPADATTNNRPGHDTAMAGESAGEAGWGLRPSPPAAGRHRPRPGGRDGSSTAGADLPV